MNADDPAVAIRSAIRDRLQQLAGEFGDLAELSRIEDNDDTGDAVWRLQPTYPDAAPVAWDESRTDDWAACLTLGMATEVHVLTSPDRSADVAADTVAAHIAAVISGDFREELWRSRRTGEPIAAIGWIRDRDGLSWRPVGDRSRPLPVVGNLLYDHRVRDYAAYDPPLWDRLLAALHDRGGAYFDTDETQRARGWTQTPRAPVSPPNTSTSTPPPPANRSCVPGSRPPSAPDPVASVASSGRSVRWEGLTRG